METVKTIHQDTICKIQQLAQEYRSPSVPAELTSKADCILNASDVDEAYSISKKTLDRALICFLALWSKKKIPGKLTIDSLEKDIKRQEVLARFLKDTDQEKGYASQVKKIAALKIQLNDLLAMKKV
jgi:hypothetical protein